MTLVSNIVVLLNSPSRAEDLAYNKSLGNIFRFPDKLYNIFNWKSHTRFSLLF